jgi:hypothetical protein
VLINIGSAFGPNNSSNTVVTSLVAQGFLVGDTANDFTYDTSAFSLDLLNCVINPALAGSKSLDVFEVGVTATTRTVRASISDTGGSTPIPDGPLYSCAFYIGFTVLPGVYLLTNSNQAAEDIAGLPLSAGGTGGSLLVIVVDPPATPTRTPSMEHES